MRRILPLILALAGCACRADDKPAAASKPLTYTEQVAKFEATVAGLSATVGNQTSELEGVKEQLKAVKAQAEATDKYVRSINGDVIQILDKVEALNRLLSADTEISVEVPKAADPPTANGSQLDAPPAEAAGQQRAELEGIGDSLDRISEELKAMQADGSTIRMRLANGEEMSVREFIEKWYKGPRSFPGNVDDHLRAHGVTDIPPEMTEETKQKWHAAIHDLGDHLLRQKQAPAAPSKPQRNRIPASASPNVAAQPRHGWQKVCQGGVCRWVWK